MELGFGGEVADLYHVYRHGYPAAVTDALVDAFGLSHEDLVVDLGCGTGQLAMPVAAKVRSGGGVAVVTNGTPLWLQDSAWSRAVREFLAGWLGSRPTFSCGTDEQSQRHYQAALARAGFEVSGAAVDYVAELSFDQLAGGIYSALPVDQLPPPDQRPAFAEQLRAAVGLHDPFSEPVHVAILTGRIP